MKPRYGLSLLILMALSTGALLAQSGPLTITTNALANGTVGLSYSQTLSATGAYGNYSWALVQGVLPAGLTLAPTGVILGTPTAVGSYPVVVQVSSTLPTAVWTATKSFTLMITAPPLSITTTGIFNGVVGEAYSANLAATGGVLLYSWSIVQGSLPAGLTLNATTGIIGGTPTAAGTFSFVAQVLDAQPVSATRAFSVTILATVKIATTSPLPSGTVGAVYSQQLIVTGGVPPYTWTAQNSSLPPGLNLGSTGLFGGTPTTAGTFTFSLTAADHRGNQDTAPFTMTVVPALAITTATALPDGSAGAPYVAQLAGTGGTAPYTWVLLPDLGTLPVGVTLDTSTGRLSGTPSAAGNYNFSVRVDDSAKRSATRAFTISINNALTILTKTPLGNGTVGSVYQQQLTATGGRPPYTWAINAGALPAGLTLDAVTGIIGGTPSAAGTFDITVAVSDSLLTVTTPYRLTIGLPAAPALSIAGLPDSGTPATQPTLSISVDKYPLDITGQATLTFTPDSGAGDPAVQFTTGGRTASFRVPAGTTQAVFNNSSIGLQTGTVAGTITVTTSILAAGVDITPTPAPSKTIRIAKAAPVIISLSLARTGSGFDLIVIGYATPREVTSAAVRLTPSSGTQLSASQFTISLSTVFTTWYQTTASATYGSQFTLRIPFTVQNVSNAVSSVSVSLANSQGASAENNAAF